MAGELRRSAGCGLEDSRSARPGSSCGAGRADRAYQIAAANFYATNYDQAKDQFDAIAKDKASPYRIVSPYLAARAMLHKGSFIEKKEDARPALSDAENRLNAILKDTSLKAAQPDATRLLNLTRVRLHPG